MNTKDQRFLNEFYRLASKVLLHERLMRDDPVYRAKIEESDRLYREAEAMRMAEEKARELAAIRNDAEYFTSDEFRADVMAEIVASGATPLQAEGRTRDQVRLFNEARELGMM